jgi:CHRD domain-containing protein
MKRLSLFAAALALFAAGCSNSSSAPTTTSPTKPTFTAALSTANEVPPITNSEAGGKGDATITFDLTKDAAGNVTAAAATFVVNLSGFPAGTPINIAHIHTGAAGVAGGVVVPTTLTAGQVVLANGSGSFTSSNSGVLAPELAQAIIANPAGYYFNAHSTLNGGGVVRGQLVKVQ